MRRLRAVAAYDGTEFCGFQRQPGARTVQGVLETALSRLCGHPVAVTGAGRTDAGVHAVGQVVHWETSSRIPAERIGPAVNTLVGPELLVRAVEDVSPDFHARFDAVRRSYRYYVTTLWPTPFRARYVLHEPSLRPEARERMQEALLPLVGEHDFAGFCRERAGHGSTVRSLLRAGVMQRGADLCVEVTATAFLRSMVRNIVGWLLEVGTGRCEPEALAEVLASRSPIRGVAAAPPRGLFLVRVEYPDGYPPAWPAQQDGFHEDLYG